MEEHGFESLVSILCLTALRRHSAVRASETLPEVNVTEGTISKTAVTQWLQRLGRSRWRSRTG